MPASMTLSRGDVAREQVSTLTHQCLLRCAMSRYIGASLSHWTVNRECAGASGYSTGGRRRRVRVLWTAHSTEVRFCVKQDSVEATIFYTWTERYELHCALSCDVPLYWQRRTNWRKYWHPHMAQIELEEYFFHKTKKLHASKSLCYGHNLARCWD
jgi:hypothetical protein